MKKLLLAVFAIILLNANLSAGYYKQESYTSGNDAGTVNKLVSALSNQLTQNKDFRDITNSSIAITSFVSLEDFKATSRLSNILSENLIHEMQVRGYKVVDFKAMEKIKVDQTGDFLFSRDVEKLRKTLKIDFALTGTYVKYRNGTVVNARIIDLKTHVVLSSAQVLIPRRVVNRITNSGNRIPNFKPNTILLSK